MTHDVTQSYSNHTAHQIRFYLRGHLLKFRSHLTGQFVTTLLVTSWTWPSKTRISRTLSIWDGRISRTQRLADLVQSYTPPMGQHSFLHSGAPLIMDIHIKHNHNGLAIASWWVRGYCESCTDFWSHDLPPSPSLSLSLFLVTFLHTLLVMIVLSELFQ